MRSYYVIMTYKASIVIKITVYIILRKFGEGRALPILEG